jgi:hypothetical protein
MGLSIDRTAVWFLGRNSKPRFCLLLWPLRGSFGRFWLHPVVPSRQTHAAATACQTATEGHTCSSPPLQFTGTLHTTGLTCQQSPKLYFIDLCWWFCELSPRFHLWDLRRDELTINWSFHTFKPRKPLKSICCHQKLFWKFHAFLMQFSRVLSKT